MNLSNRDRALSYGRGLNILLSWQAFSQKFTIFNATFSKNSAEGGGGLALTLKENANCNEILIQDCSFACNTAGGGGGVKIELHKSKNEKESQQGLTIFHSINVVLLTIVLPMVVEWH